MSINLGNVVGLLRSQTPPTKKYLLWAKVLNPTFPDIVEINYWDEVSLAWTPVTDSTTQYWLRPVISIATAPPVSPVEGDRHLVAPTGATGAFSGKEDQVATWRNLAWVFTIPLDGYIVSNRAEVNKLYDYRGTYGSGGDWFENDFQVPIAPGTYIPSTEKGAALGVVPLDVNTKILFNYINGSTLPFTPINPGDWLGGTDNVWSALEQVRTLAAIGASVLTNGSGTTASGTTLNLGGSLSADANLIIPASTFVKFTDNLAQESYLRTGRNVNLFETVGLYRNDSIPADTLALTIKNTEFRSFITQNIGTIGSTLLINGTGQLLSSIGGGGVNQSDITNQYATGITITQAGTGRFFGAAADYSAQYTNRSYIDKGFADATYISILAGDYWSRSSGGILTSPNVIDFSTYSLTFTGTTGQIFFSSDGYIDFTTTGLSGINMNAPIVNLSTNSFYVGGLLSNLTVTDSFGGGFIVNTPDGNIEIDPTKLRLSTYINSIRLDSGGSIYLTTDTDNLYFQVDGTLDVDVNEGYVVSGPILTFEGIRYNANYSTNYTIRSLIDKGYADATYAALTSASISFVTDSFSVNPISGGGMGYSTSGFEINLPDGSFLYFNDLQGFKILTVSNPIEIVSGTSIEITAIGVDVIVDTEFTIHGPVLTFQGAEYSNDFSANYTLRSLIDKGYADSNYLRTGGTSTLSSNLLIDSTNIYGIDIGLPGQLLTYFNVNASTAQLSADDGVSTASLSLLPNNFTLSISYGTSLAGTPSNILIDGDNGTFQGLVYNQDFSNEFVAGSLINKGYTDLTYAPLLGGTNVTNFGIGVTATHKLHIQSSDGITDTNLLLIQDDLAAYILQLTLSAGAGYLEINARAYIDSPTDISFYAGTYFMVTAGSYIDMSTNDYINITAGTTLTLASLGNHINITSADQVIITSAMGTSIEGNILVNTNGLGFYGTLPVLKATALTAALTTVTFTAPGTPDYDYGVGTNSSAWGWSSSDEFTSAISVIANLQERVNELETKLQTYGLLT